MDLSSLLYVMAQAGVSPGAWESLVDRWGWPGAILAVLAFVGWRVAKFARPYVERWFEAQIELLKTLKDSQQNRDALDARYHDQIERFLDSDKEQTAAIGGLHARHDKHDEQLVAIRKHLEGPK